MVLEKPLVETQQGLGSLAELREALETLQASISGANLYLCGKSKDIYLFMETSELSSPQSKLRLSHFIILLVDRRQDEANGIKWHHEVVPQPWARLPLESWTGLIPYEGGVIDNSPRQMEGKRRSIKKIVQANARSMVHQKTSPSSSRKAVNCFHLQAGTPLLKARPSP